MSLSDIGVIIEGEGAESGGLVAVDEDGTERLLAIEGWDHFR